jgi:hypothetical protein
MQLIYSPRLAAPSYSPHPFPLGTGAHHDPSWGASEGKESTFPESTSPQKEKLPCELQSWPNKTSQQNWICKYLYFNTNFYYIIILPPPQTFKLVLLLLLCGDHVFATYNSSSPSSSCTLLQWPSLPPPPLLLGPPPPHELQLETVISAMCPYCRLTIKKTFGCTLNPKP